MNEGDQFGGPRGVDGSGLAGVTPCFVAGQAKSGTTLLVSLLDNHPQLLAFPEETAYYPTVNTKFAQSSLGDRLGYLFDEGESRFVFHPEIEASFGRDYSSFPGQELRELVEKNADEQTDRHLLEVFVESYGELIRSDFSKLRGWVEKTPANRDHIEAIRQDFPGCKILLTLRDPRAVMAARLMLERGKKPNHSFSIYDNLKNWTKAAKNVIQYREDRKHFFIVCFEDLLSRPEDTMRELAEFLEIDFEPCLLHPSKVGQRWGGNSADRASDFQAISTEPIDRWKSVLKPQEVAWIEHYCGDLMVKLGYELTGARWSRSNWLRRLDGESWKTWFRSRRKLMSNGIRE